MELGGFSQNLSKVNFIEFSKLHFWRPGKKKVKVQSEYDKESTPPIGGALIMPKDIPGISKKFKIARRLSTMKNCFHKNLDIY